MLVTQCWHQHYINYCESGFTDSATNLSLYTVTHSSAVHVRSRLSLLPGLVIVWVSPTQLGRPALVAKMQ